MGILTEDMKRVVSEQRVRLRRDRMPGWHSQLVAQRNRHLVLWDDDHIVFAHIRLPRRSQI